MTCTRCVSVVFAFIVIHHLHACYSLKQISGDTFRDVLYDESKAEYWKDRAQNFLHHQLNVQKWEKPGSESRSAILVVGSGMSLTTITAATRAKGQKKKVEQTLDFQKFPVVGIAKTYCLDSQVGDDFCTSAALINGIKSVSVQNYTQNNIKSIAEWALAAGKDVGIVTTSRITHPSIAGLYANRINSSWESDADIETEDLGKCLDFACQLIKGPIGGKIKVILGGGYNNFLPKGVLTGRRHDGQNLLKVWIGNKALYHRKYNFIGNAVDLENVGDEDYLFGLFSQLDMDYNRFSDDQQPSLEAMVVAALKVLSKNKNGYFLFVFGGNINKAHDNNQARLAVEETIELSKAVGRMTDMTSNKNTLVVVTADHGSTMTMSGYSEHWADIFGFIDKSRVQAFDFPILSYATGPGYEDQYKILNCNDTFSDIGDVKFKYPSGVPTKKAAYGGEDVAVFAKGPFQHIFTGTYDSSLIPHMIGYAICIGPGQKSCDSNSSGRSFNLNISILTLLIVNLILKLI